MFTCSQIVFLSHHIFIKISYQLIYCRCLYDIATFTIFNTEMKEIRPSSYTSFIHNIYYHLQKNSLSRHKNDSGYLQRSLLKCPQICYMYSVMIHIYTFY